MSALAIVYALYPDAGSAEAAALDAVERRLAACANLLAPCRSIYRWEGAVQRATEVPVIFKTSAGGVEALMAHLRASHGYDLPAISSWPAATTPDYAAWVAEETRG